MANKTVSSQTTAEQIQNKKDSGNNLLSVRNTETGAAAAIGWVGACWRGCKERASAAKSINIPLKLNKRSICKFNKIVNF